MSQQRSAIVVDIRGSSAAALTAGGEYIRVRNEGYEIGQSILLSSDSRAAHHRARVSALVSMAAGLALLFFGGFTGYVTPAGVVSLDVNPSIEYTINYFDRVLEIDAVNDDGGQILLNMDEQALLYHSVDDAVVETILELRASGYLMETTENDVMLSASSYTIQHAEQIAERLQERVGQQSDLTVYSVSVEKEDVESAHEMGTSAGKLYLIEKLGESIGEEEEFDPEDWVEKPVREIIAETKGKPDSTNNAEEKDTPGLQNTPGTGAGGMGGSGNSGNMPESGSNGEMPEGLDDGTHGQGSMMPEGSNMP